MRMPRFSIAALLAGVAIVAINLALARFAYAFNPGLLIGGALPCLSLQWAACSLICRRGPARVFWFGFALFGSIMASLFVEAMRFPELNGVTSTGVRVKRPGSPLYAIWMSYDRFAGDRIGLHFSDNPDPNSPVIMAIRVVLWAAPQLLVAAIGGLAARGILRTLSRGGLRAIGR